MKCQKVTFSSPWILKMYALRQQELRAPIGLSLFKENLLGEHEELFFCATKGEELISCLQFRIIDEERLKLRQMATETNYKGLGYGRQLVNYSEDWARTTGYKIIELHARKVAQGFYEKLGYEIVGEEFLEVDMLHFKMQKTLVE